MNRRRAIIKQMSERLQKLEDAYNRCKSPYLFNQWQAAKKRLQAKLNEKNTGTQLSF